MDPELVGLFNRVMGDWRASRTEPGVKLEADPALWGTLDELGLTRLTTEADATWLEAAALLRAAAKAAAPLPLAENDLLGHWLLAIGDTGDREGTRTVALLEGSNEAARVPWARFVDGVVVLGRDDEGWYVADAPARHLSIRPAWDLAGQPRDTVIIDTFSLQRTRVDESVVAEYRLRGALARSIQMVGAMEQAIEMSAEFARDRYQFGRPLAKFQAVQHLLADAACECALARAATESAVGLIASPGHTSDELALRVLVAKSVTGHAVSAVVRKTHQVHGAIGTTLEYPLHEFTKPALAWSSEFISVSQANHQLAQRLLTGNTSVWTAAVPLPAGDRE
ncbi:acyl-CoA dehydrogenase family protein [Nocardioides pyridinolyticus]